MDIEKNKIIFTELYTNIKQQAEKSLSILVDHAYQIDNFLKIEHTTIWLELEIPSYTESDDFRIVVQNEILDERVSMKATCIGYMSQIIDYREQCAIASKEFFKRPKFDDNYYLIFNLDNQLHKNLKLMLIEMKSYILHICNILTKNKDLIKRQSSHHQHVNNYF